MDRVKINKFEEPQCTLYNPNGEVVGKITSLLQLTDIRLQIREQNLDGYYVKWVDFNSEEKTTPITPFGRFGDDWPRDFVLNLLVSIPKRNPV